MTFDPEYINDVLSQNFEDAKALFLAPLLAIHRAHLVMLASRGIVSPADARALRQALDAVSPAEIRAHAFDGSCEDLFFFVERLIVNACGEVAAGRLHEARRSRLDDLRGPMRTAVPSAGASNLRSPSRNGGARPCP